jgi:hypothetical protein
LGRSALALPLYERVASEAVSERTPSAWLAAIEQAREASKRLEVELPRLTIVLGDDWVAPVVVRVDKRSFELSEGEAHEFFVDVGRHDIVATDAEGRQLSTRWHAALFGRFAWSVQAPKDVREKVGDQSSPANQGGIPSAPRARSTEAQKSGPSPWAKAQWVSYSLSGVSLGISGITFLSALGRARAIVGRCPDKVCVEDERAAIGRAERDLRMSTAALVVGGVGLATGLSLTLIASSKRRVRPSLALSPTDVRIGFRF